MTGKSTLLRAVGVNAVLALAGAPVRAERLVLSRLAIGATLEVEDSLQSGQSRFYAEIPHPRRSSIIARARCRCSSCSTRSCTAPIRTTGGSAPRRSSVRWSAAAPSGWSRRTTSRSPSFPPRSAPPPRTCTSRIGSRTGAMVFDYRMRPGVVEHSNALALMRAVGLDV